MSINWPLIIVLFCLSIPGTLIAIKRLIYFLLPDNTEELKKRVCRFAMIQTLILILIMCFTGAIISTSTGLHAPILEALLVGKVGFSALIPILLPAVLFAILCLTIFCFLYYILAKRLIDEKSRVIMMKLRQALGIDGCILYGGVVEEIIGRWGILNLTTFFAVIFTKQLSPLILWTSIIISGLIFAMGQLPTYIAAGCTSNRWFIYFFIVLSMCQSIIFGYVFWQYGLICAIFAHMLFHLGWALVDDKLKSSITH
ncbi:MAG: CPBP family intramembrane metalloprotease [Legionella sp.]|uniref:CPBP family intramembrane glutamate endopeptidase n=1 Tax=Legionella sp. TaxID=459 RepID=UPI0039E3D89D